LPLLRAGIYFAKANMNEWALVTGASAGIGRELARVFAADKWNLALTARDEGRMDELAQELRARHGILTKVLAADLAQPHAARALYEALADTPVSCLVNNAGFGGFGPFAEGDVERQAALMQVNMVAPVELTRLFVQPMLQRGRGRILNVASVAAFQPGPTVNLYYASKAFMYSFSYSLAVELDNSGVTVSTLCPGSTRTEFFDRARMHAVRPIRLMDARRVAEAGYRGMMRGQRVVIPGWANRLVATISPCLPTAWTAAAVRRIHEPRNNK
jgi:short-subunit dehydrogenase